jgi:hypothetical protein
MNRKNKKMSTNQIKLYLDIVIFFFFLVVSAPQATGFALHEWLSFAFLAAFVFHLVLNWKWIVNVIQRFFKKLPGETRFNAVWNVLLFILGTVVFFSGVFVSEAALPLLGYRSILGTNAQPDLQSISDLDGCTSDHALALVCQGFQAL